MSRRTTPEIIQATKDYITEYPTHGKERVRQYIKERYAAAPSNEAILDLKREVWGMSPNVAYIGWRRAGFTPYEAKELVFGSKGVRVDWAAVFNSIPGKRARASRQRYINEQVKAGKAGIDILKTITDYYKAPNTNPFDHIKVEYRPPKKADYRDYTKQARVQAKSRQKSLYGR